MDSKNLASTGFKGFNNWKLIEISENRISRDVIPEAPGVYILRQKGCKNTPYKKSDIVKIGETSNTIKKDLAIHERKSNCLSRGYL